MSSGALVTIAVPSFNQGQFIEDALHSIFNQGVPVEVFVADGGSQDNSVEIIRRWHEKLAGWRSHRDAGQAAAINECIAKGRAPYVCWLNSDDFFLPGGLTKLVYELDRNAAWPAVYGRAWNHLQSTGSRSPVWVQPFSERGLALRCIVSQPATLIRRSAWDALGGVDAKLSMAMDYDLWWRLYKRFGPLGFINDFVAVNREHEATKTSTQRQLHYAEAIKIVRRHYGHVPLKWWLAQPYAVWYKAIRNSLRLSTHGRSSRLP